MQKRTNREVPRVLALADVLFRLAGSRPRVWPEDRLRRDMRLGKGVERGVVERPLRASTKISGSALSALIGRISSLA